MEDLLLLNDINFAEEVLLYELSACENSRHRAKQYGRFHLDDLSAEECKSYFRFEREHIEPLAAALGIPHEIEDENGYVVSGLEGLCICLRRLAYPNRLSDLETIFGLSTPYISVISNTVIRIILQNKGHLLSDLSNLPWLNRDRLEYYSQAISAKGAPVQNCWAFIDETARPICRPSVHQQEFYSGHKRQHCVKYQTLVCPDGITVSLHGPYPGRRHDAGIFRESPLYPLLQRTASFPDENFVIYGNRV